MRYTLISFGVLGLVLSMLWSSYQASVAERDNLAVLYARTIESSITRTLESVENSFFPILQDLSAYHNGNTPDLNELKRRVSNVLRFAPHIRQVVLFKGDEMLFDSNPRSKGVVDLNRVRFPFMQASRLSSGLKIGDTIEGRFLPINGQDIEEQSRRKLVPLLLEEEGEDPANRYRIFVALNAHYLESIFLNAELIEKNLSYLLRADGGKLLSSGEYAQEETVVQAVIRAVGEGQDERILAFNEGLLSKTKTMIRLSSKFPLAIVISIDHQQTFYDWVEENQTLITALLIASFIVLWLAFWIYLDLQRFKVLRKEVNLLSAAVHQSPVSFLITDKEGRIAYANPAFEKTYGYSAKDYLKRTPAIIKSGKTGEEVYRDLWGTVKSGDSWHGEFMNKTKDGKLIPTSTAISPVVSDDGTTEYLVGVLLDISEQKALQEQALAASRAAQLASEAKSNFLATMSHELRTPMTGIQGIIELLKGRKTTVQEHEELLNDLSHSSNALMVLLNDILDLSKIEAGKLRIENVACNPSEVVQNVIHLFKETAQSKNVLLTSNAAAHAHVWIRSDSLRLRQVLSNLVSNAIKFTDKGSVKVDLNITPLSVGKMMMQLSVADSGIGMDKAQLQTVFDPFTQADASTTRKYGGTGLGLTITKQLCTLLGGRLKVNSEPDVGSTFYVEIPVDIAHAPHTIDCRPATIGALDILLSEDNKVNQKVVSALLRQKGHKVDIAENGKVAVEKADLKKYDMILMDMQMPVMDGTEATQHIRAHSKFNTKTLIFAFTADAFPEHHGKYLQAGLNDVVTKPLRWEQLDVKLKEHLYE